MDLLNYGDINKVVYTDDNWQIRFHQNRGYDPWHTLHKRRRFLGITWWGSSEKLGEFDQLRRFVDRWNNWPPAEQADQPKDVEARG